MENRVNEFKSLILRLASPQDIHSWSKGEVTKPETINYRTQRPERDGLFCERIFGPVKDFECYCGKYRRVRYKGIICDKCGVEVTRSIVRRERMGHIELASPVAHIWFVRGVPSRLGLLLDISIPDLEKVIYFAGYIVMNINEEMRQEALKGIEREYKSKIKQTDDKASIKEAAERTRAEIRDLKLNLVLSESAYHKLSIKYGDVFEAETGAEALKKILEKINLEEYQTRVAKELEEASPIAKKKLLGRIKLLKSLIKAHIRPEDMLLTVIPVIPPDVRPIVQLDGGKHATSDVNDLYRRVINRNNRLKRLFELSAPEVIVRNEKRMLQEAVDALIDNSMRKAGAPVNSQTQRRPLRSLADMLKGKQGRFRQNLLGKRVDYSGRSVIVIGPNLKLHQCGLPKHMALELFRPFVIHKLIDHGLAHNIRGAGKLIEEATPEVWAILEEVIEGKYVLLNRAPTLHRLGIQAFMPLLIEGNAIELHPLVCQAFNADFDGDQMAVHIPLTKESQEEAREIMASSKNLLKPGTGEPITVPTQDIVLGCYWLTKFIEGAKGEDNIFASKNEAVFACDIDVIDLRAKVKIMSKDASHEFIETSVGRIIFNTAFPNDFGFINDEMNKKRLSGVVDELLRKYGHDSVPPILDKIKDIGFKYATKSGLSWGMNDLQVPSNKEGLIKKGREEVKVINEQYERGLLTDEERYNKVIEVWGVVSKGIGEAVPETLDKKGSVYSMVNSAARGSWGALTQMSGLKGLVRNPSGHIIELPILSSYKEGLSVLEYFNSTHGARKGTADTALKTAVAGYLTRRLADVAQDIIISEEDCGTVDGIEVNRKDYEDLGVKLHRRIFGRTLLQTIKSASAKKDIFKAGHLLSPDDARKIDELGIDSVFIRSPITCKTWKGICKKCYGYDLGHNKEVDLGEAVGIVAAQAIGEPGTQLTMRTFHTGGVAEAGRADITMGLPRVEEIFEARIPKSRAIIAECDGEIINIEEKDREKTIEFLKDEDSSKKKTKKEDKLVSYTAPFGRMVLVKKGDKIKSGTQLTDGSIELKELHAAGGKEAVQRYILKEVSKMYILQGAAINQKHIEVMTRQMFSRVRIKDPGTTNFAEGEIIDKRVFYEENDTVEREGGTPAKESELLMGITKVSLTTSSFLSAASFQETSRVLIRAALEGREDHLIGLKENVIIGNLIPAGTGYRKKLAGGNGEESAFVEEFKEEEAEA
ncbi:DNA-directed RNA polymerase subunit beta' [Patescibacteria group bacterium]